MVRVALASTSEGTILAVRGADIVLAAGANINVYEHGTETPVAVFAAETGEGLLSQPLTATNQGGVPGFVEAGQRITLAVTFDGETVKQTVEVMAGDEVTHERERAEAEEALLAPLANPVFTGVPEAPTAPANTNDTQLATTAYADRAAQASSGLLTPGEVTTNQLLAWGHAYVANAEGGNLVLTLPPATGNGGKFLYVEIGPHSGVNTVILERSGAEKIIVGEEELTQLVLSLGATPLSGVMLIAIANNPRVF